jgi:broad specificity phosphatase PhoE
MIILIRHAQSEGNKNRDIHQFIPDHRVKLTQHGWTQVRGLVSQTFKRVPLMLITRRQRKPAASCGRC